MSHWLEELLDVTIQFMTVAVSIGHNAHTLCSFSTCLVANLVSSDQSIPAVQRWWLPAD